MADLEPGKGVQMTTPGPGPGLPLRTALPAPGRPNGRVPLPNVALPQTRLNVVPPARPLVRPPLVPKAVVQPAAVYQPPAVNPYLRLPHNILRALAQQRDVALTGSDREQAEQMFQYDQIDPAWFQSIQAANLHTLPTLDRSKIYVFGALHGVDYREVEGMDARQLTIYTQLAIIAPDPQHPSRAIFGVLLEGVTRSCLRAIAKTVAYIPERYLPVLTSEEIRQALKVSRLSVTAAELDQRVIRLQMFNTGTNFVQLCRLYQCNNTNNDKRQVLTRPPHPMETILANLGNYSTQDLCGWLGMVIPISQAANPRGYITANLVDYAGILTRNLPPLDFARLLELPAAGRLALLRQLKDTELFELTSTYVPYSSREELVANLQSAFVRPQFLFVTVRNRAVNSETVIGSEVTDLETFMVAYGTCRGYRLYELEELQMSFHRDDQTGAIVFRRPENQGQEFGPEDIYSLQQLLQMFPPQPGSVALLQRIAEGLVGQDEQLESDRVMRQELQDMAGETKELIKQYLHRLFECGMYMRRWDGPGHPYPLVEAETKRQTEPDAVVTQQLGLGMELLQAMGPAAKQYCMHLRLCRYRREGGVESGQEKLKRWWDPVIRGDACIRQASAYFVGTSLHYLRILYHVNIPGVDVRRIDNIV